MRFTGDTGAAGGSTLWPVFAITSVFTVNNLIAFSLSTAARARVARVLAADLSARALNRAFCALLARVALWMLLG